MAVPDFQTLMRPLLVSLESGDDRTITSIRGELAERFALSQADLDERVLLGLIAAIDQLANRSDPVPDAGDEAPPRT